MREKTKGLSGSVLSQTPQDVEGNKEVKRPLISLILLLTLLVPAYSNNELEIIIPPTPQHITKNIHILIDSSGSMSPTQISLAINQALEIAEQPNDDFNIAITMFGLDWARMTVVDENCKRGVNWMAMPSADNLKKIEQWCANTEIAKHDTNVIEPLRAALEENNEELSVIIITDCEVSLDRLLVEMNNTAVPIGIIGVYTGEVMKQKTKEVVEKDNEGWFVNITR